MKSSTVRELHLKTSEIVRQVAAASLLLTRSAACRSRRFDLSRTARGFGSWRAARTVSIRRLFVSPIAHRKVREAPVTPADAAVRRDLFLDDVCAGVITTVPVTERLLRRVEGMTRALPVSCHLQTFDALHLVTAAGPW